MQRSALGDIRAALDGVSESRAAALAALITLVAGMATITSDLIGVYFDDAIYLLVAKGIAEGHGYVYPQLPGMPPAIHYPPVWPGLLALVWKLGPAWPANVGLLKAINPIVLAAAAYGGTLAGQRLFGLRAWAAACLIVVATVSVPMQVLTNVLLSEPLFAALLFPTVLVAERLRVEGGWRLAVAAAVLAALLVLTRTIAGAFVLATGLVLLLERRYRDAVVYGAVVAVLLAPWQYFVWRHSVGFPDILRGSYGPYLEWVSQGYRELGPGFVMDVAKKNLADTWHFVGAMTSPLLAETVFRPMSAALATAFTLLGIVTGLARPRERIMALGLGVYLAIVLVWPFQTDRFVWAAWPVLLLFALGGVRFLHARAGHQALRWSAAVAGALLVTGYLTYNVRGISRGWISTASGSMSERSLAVVQRINSAPELDSAVIATEATPLVGLYTGNLVVPVERLDVSDHLAKKTPEQSAAVLQAVETTFTPDAYVFMSGGPHLRAFILAVPSMSRRFVETSNPTDPVRIFRPLSP